MFSYWSVQSDPNADRTIRQVAILKVGWTLALGLPDFHPHVDLSKNYAKPEQVQR